MIDLVEIRTTETSGRGIFAKTTIPKDTLIHASESPYASIIYPEFKKEVCALCHKYSLDNDRHTWSIRSEDNGVWFCSDQCKIVWESELNVDGILKDVNDGFNMALRKVKRVKGDGAVALDPIVKDGQQVVKKLLDDAWNSAEDVASRNSLQSSSIIMDDVDIRNARFVASAIAKRYIEENTSPSCTAKPRNGVTWADFMRLQDNEVPHVSGLSWVIDMHIKVYHFLRLALPPKLQRYVQTPDMVRAVFARDPGNSFGLWQKADDAEMFGWAIYVSSSLFNHNCAPNLRKESDGEDFLFYTNRDIMAGEELHISYVDIKDDTPTRRTALKENWYFDCICSRCREQ